MKEKILGYDVREMGCESQYGLTKHGRFKRNLNEYMLFPTLAKADEFREACDANYELGYPHMIYGIWRVGEIVL